MRKHIAILNGPNINLVGQRQPEIYGSDTLEDIARNCETLGAELGVTTTCMQSNAEGQVIDWIQDARTSADAIIINAAALTHTSIGILDALHAFEGPVIEVHISNIHQREEFRHFSYISLRANGVIVGCGIHGYELAVRQAAKLLEN